MSKTQREWMVSMRFTGIGTAFVTADTAAEAEAKAARGEWNLFDEGKTENYEVRGSAEPNE